jgi:F1F0 ATPase subunit 2
MMDALMAALGRIDPTDPLSLALALIGGAGIGLLHFGGLWWTVRRIGERRNPAALLLASQLLRTGATVLLLYLVAGSAWERLLAAAAGLLIVRRVMARRLGPAPEATPGQRKGLIPWS